LPGNWGFSFFRSLHTPAPATPWIYGPPKKDQGVLPPYPTPLGPVVHPAPGPGLLENFRDFFRDFYFFPAFFCPSMPYRLRQPCGSEGHPNRGRALSRRRHGFDSRWDYQLTYLNHAQKSYKPAYNACTRIVPNGTIRGFFIFRSKPNKGLLPHAKIIPLKRQSRTWDTNALENSGANNRPAPRGWSLATNPIRLPGVFGIIASLSVKTPREKSFWGFLFSKRLKQEEE
jgi:hypothetical protein